MALLVRELQDMEIAEETSLLRPILAQLVHNSGAF
jgi:hypothetical protein